MNIKNIYILISLIICFNLYIAQNTHPTVSNVSHSYNSTTGVVTVTYDVADGEENTVNVLMEVSSDGGVSFDYACTQVSGAIGENIAEGTGKTIIWNHDAEHGTAPVGSNFIIKIVADDVVGDQIYYEGTVYNTVTIGDQVWLKENLDVGTMQGGEDMSEKGVIAKYCFDHDPSNCEIYGGLYRWPQAMQNSTNEGAQGICPSGWHIPTKVEFDALKAHVNNDGNALKAIGQGTGAGAGTNTSGFSALLAGFRDAVDGFFVGLNLETYYWTSTEDDPIYKHYATLGAHSGSFFSSIGVSSEGYSIRCIKDPAVSPTLTNPENNSTDQSISPTFSWSEVDNADSYTLQVSLSEDFSSFEYNQDVGTNTIQQVEGLDYNTTHFWRVSANISGNANWSDIWSFTTSEGFVCGSSTVAYSGKTYNTVQIGGQCWLKENLNLGTMIQGSVEMSDNGILEKYCYDNNPTNCETYGGLYQWNEAMQYITTAGAQGICPEGWHIPTLAEFETLETYVNDQAAALIDESETLDYTPTVTQNETGFSALFAGYRHTNGNIYNLGSLTYFWSSTELLFSSYFAHSMHMNDVYSYVSLNGDSKGDGFSVRCVQD